MADNKDFWKDLLGDEYDEKLYDSVTPEVPAETPPSPSVPARSPAPGDEPQFVEFNFSAPNSTGDAGPAKSGDTSDFQYQDNSDTGKPDFEVDFDFDGEYRDVPTDRPLKVRRQRRTGCLGGILYAVFIICVSLVLAALLWMAAADVLALGKPEGERTITVPDGADVEEITDILSENGMIKYKRLFKLYCKFSDSAKEMAGGTYTLNTNYDYRALVIGLIPGTGKRVEVDVAIPEGYNLFQIFDLLDEEGVCGKDDLWDTAANYDFDYAFLDKSTLGDKLRLEGYLFPDTYRFYLDDNPTHVIDKFLSNFKNKFTDEYAARAEEMGYTMRDILTIASLIEREAAFDAERDAIASVIHNRLNSANFPFINIDASIYYGITVNGDTRDAFSTEYDSPYNTYTHTGLPPGPICNPGIQSIRGALYPQETDYYYYALSVEGGHRFFSYYESFLDFLNSEEYDPGT
ncbi:MAG: endolytic transglycosylase MltG [Oscillospiraceae bacterium]|nr:endolytic transglycosylase MltG [Oscillospiraceae bacterium]